MGGWREFGGVNEGRGKQKFTMGLQSPKQRNHSQQISYRSAAKALLPKMKSAKNGVIDLIETPTT
jgi:hypothetical protein